MYLHDSIYGHITLPDELKEIIDTIPFQRLRHIKQLGLVHYLYPSAQHTRFEHSLGVAYLCYELIKKIQLKQPDLEISDRDVLLITIAGLIHDIGHACFSHFFDDKLMANEQIMPLDHKNYYLRIHEARSEYIFAKIVKEYNLNYTEEEIELVCSYVNPKTHGIDKNKTTKNKFRYEIVSNYISGFDCDKLDYLVRDSYYLGNTINLNVLSLIDNAIVINDTICYPQQMISDVYSVYHSRFIFHKKYYGNNITRGIEYMIYDSMLKSKYFKNIADILDTDDFYTFTDNIMQLMLTEESCCDLIKNIYTRNIYKMTNETNVNIDYETDLKNVMILINEFLDHNQISKDFIFDVVKINYGKGKYDPTKYVSFYTKRKNICKITNENKSYGALQQQYEEISFKIFIRSANPDKLIYENLKTNNCMFSDVILNGNISAEMLSDLILIFVNDYLKAHQNLNKKYANILTKEIRSFDKIQLLNVNH